MHDDQQVVRLQQLDKSLMAGQFPVRWVEDLGFGMGYPLFNFYPPFTYYLGEVFHLVGFSFIDSIKMVWFVALVGSALAMYLLTRNLLASIVYLYAPYHAIDAYVRGALAELFSFVWLPLILHFSLRNRPILTGVLLGLLMITHNLVFLPFTGILLLWSLFWGSKYFFRSCISLAISFFLTAFFWLPSLVEKQFTLVDQLLIRNLASYKIHFLCLSQLWWGQWGFGGSVPGCADGLSFALGKLAFIFIFGGFLVTLSKRSKLGLISLILLCFSLFMTLPYSQFVWDRIPPLWYLQFPWRFLEFAALFTAVLAGLLRSRILVIALIPLIIFVNAKYFKPQQYLPQATDELLTSDQNVKWNISSSSFEYMPSGVVTYVNDRGVVWVDINQEQVKSQKSKVKINGGDVIQQEFTPDRFTLVGNFWQNASVQFNITNFPGWKVWVDGKEIPINDNNKYKLITVDVEPGDHRIAGKFAGTLVRTIGNIISLVTLVCLGVALWKQRK